MAIKSEYYRFNGTSWELFYFKTSIDMVDGLVAALASKAPTANPTFTGTASFGALGADGPIYAQRFEGPIAYTSTPPTAVSTYGLSFYVGTTDPITKYAGWVYIII